MTTVSADYLPRWLLVPPETWPRQELASHQVCRQCDREMAVSGVLCTNFRGGWEHLDCALRAREVALAALAGDSSDGRTRVLIRTWGRQRDLVDAVHADPSRELVVGYDPGRGRTERYSWRPL